MAIGRISGPMLYSNLERQGVPLQVDTDLAYFDVSNRRLGIGTITPTQSLDVPGNVRLANLSIIGNQITSNTGKINLGSVSNITLSGGSADYILYTDGAGNLGWASLNTLSGLGGFTGNNITLGTNTTGNESNAVVLTTLTTVTDGISLLNQLLGNITNSTGTTVHTGNVTASVGFTGTILTNNQSYITTVGTLTGLTVAGNASFGSGNVTIQDNIINLHTNSALSPWAYNDGSDIGIKMHYYDTQDSHAFLGRANDTGYLEWYARGAESGNVFSGGTYGTIKTGELVISNSTPSTSTTTGALRVAGGASFLGNVFIGSDTWVYGNLHTGPIYSISAAGATIAGNISGTISTGDQPYITSLGTLANLNVAGPVSIVGNSSITGNIIPTANAAYFLGNTTDYWAGVYAQNINGQTASFTTISGNISATNVLGTVATANVSLYDSVTSTTTNATFYPQLSGVLNGNAVTNTATTITVNPSTGNLTIGNLSTNTASLSTAVVSGNVSASNFIGITYGNVHTDYITPNTSSVVSFNFNTALALPTGTSAQRPGTAVTGYFRYNQDIGTVEYFNGTTWVTITNNVSGETVVGDGVNTTYTLSQNSTAIATIVSINGTVQRPGVAYGITGNQITFAEVPQSTDVIDIRYLATSITPNFNLASIDAGAITVGNTTTVIDSFSTSVYRSAKYTISSTSPVDSHMADVQVIQNSGNVAYNAYSILNTGSNTLTYSANISGGTVYVTAQGTASTNSVRIQRTYFSV